MKIRGWLILGDDKVSWNLPEEKRAGIFMSMVPDASKFEPGTYIGWMVAGSIVTLVCIEIPIGG